MVGMRVSGHGNTDVDMEDGADQGEGKAKRS